MDRIDIRIEVRPVKLDELLGEEKEESSEVIRGRIEEARERQLFRFRGENFFFNSDIPQRRLGEYIRTGDKETEMLRRVYEKGELSARGYFKVLRLARTIADLNHKDEIGEEEISEALFFRNVAEEGGGQEC